MADEAEFTVKLTDKVSGNSRKAKRGVEGVEDSLGKLTRAAEKASRARQREEKLTAKTTARAARTEQRLQGRKIAQRDRMHRTLRRKALQAIDADERRAFRAARRNGAGGGGRRGARGGGGGGRRGGGGGGRGFFSGGGGGGRGGFGGGMLDVLGGNLLTKAITKTLELGVAAASTAKDFITFGQNSTLALTQLSKHGNTGEKQLELARVLAKKFGLDVMDTTAQYRDFLAMQFSPRAATDMIKMGADMRMLGADGEKLHSVFRAITQIKGKGRLQLEELTGQLGEAGLSADLVFARLEKSLGKDRKGVLAAITAGAVDADTGIAAIKGAVMDKLQIKKLGESGKKFADTTIDGIQGRLKALLQDTGLKVVEKVVDPLTRILSKTLDRLERFLNSDEGKKFVDRLTDSLGNGIKAIEKFLDRDFSLDSLKTMLLQLGDAMRPVGHAVGVAIGEGILSGIKGALKWDTSDPLASTGRMLLAGDELAGKLLEGMARGFLPGKMVDVAKMFGENIKTQVKAALGIHSPSRVFAEIGGRTAEGFALGMERGDRVVGAAASSMTDSAIWGPTTAATSSGPSDAVASSMSVGGSPVFSPTITVTVTGGASGADTGQLVADEVERRVEAVFRRLAMEG